jgi:hypothetical protein
MTTRHRVAGRDGPRRHAAGALVALLSMVSALLMAPPAGAAAVPEAGQYVPVAPGRVLSAVGIAAGGAGTLASVGPAAVTFTNAPAEVRNLAAGAVVIANNPPAPF